MLALEAPVEEGQPADDRATEGEWALTTCLCATGDHRSSYSCGFAAASIAEVR